MPKSKSPRKKKAVKRGIKLVQNVDYYEPILLALGKTDIAPFNNVANLDPLTEEMQNSILSPFEKALEKFGLGVARFDDYWILTQSLYVFAHLIKDALTNQKYRIYEFAPQVGERLNDLAVQYWLEDYEVQLAKAQTEYVEVIHSIGERHRRTGKYGMTGDERNAFLEIKDSLEELLSWCSVSMVTRAVQECMKNLVNVETKIFNKLS